MTQQQRYLVISATVAALIVTGPALAQHASHGTTLQHQERDADDHQYLADHVGAVAALEPTEGSVDGWGRAMVRDQLLPDGEARRHLVVRVIDLEPLATFSVVINAGNDFEVGAIETDEAGDGQLHLGWPNLRLPPVPAELPPAETLVSARVLSGQPQGGTATVLEGEFVVEWYGGTGPCDVTYLERIALDPTFDPDVRGIARVYRADDGGQTFESRACRLEPEAPFLVQVYSADDPSSPVISQQLTTDVVGHGEIELAIPDTVAIETLRGVEWLDQYGDAVLVGEFTGESTSGCGGGPGGGGSGEPGGSGDGGGPGGGGGGNGGGGGCP